MFPREIRRSPSAVVRTTDLRPLPATGMNLLYLLAAAVAPVVLIIKGKDLLGRQTHPAAIFILAWILCGYLLGMAGVETIYQGGASFLWIGICFPIVAMIRKKQD